MPARGPEISVRISSRADEFSASVAQIKRDLASLPKLAEQAGRGMDRGAARFGGFDIGKEISRATRAARGGIGAGLGAFGAVSRMVPGFGALAGAASIAGLGEMVSHFASAGIELQNTARLAGTSAEGLNSLRGAARLIGLSAGDADQAMLGLNRTLQDATFGRNPAAAASFQQLGISFGDMAHGARTAGAVLPEIVDKVTELAKIDPRRAEHLLELVGIPSSALPLLMRGRQALEAQRQEVEAIFGSFSEYEKQSEKFTAAQAHLSLVTEKLGMDVMTAAGPALSSMMGQLDRFVRDHKDDISSAIGRIGESILKTDWKALGQGAENIGGALSFAAKHAGELTTALEALAAARGARWLAGIFGWPAVGVAAVGGAAGAAAGAMNVPMVDDLGRQTGNWGGTEGEANQRAGERRISRMAGGWEYGGEPLPSAGPKPTNRVQEERLRVGRNILMGLGWTSQQAAGIMANLHQESGLNETSVGDGGQAYGVAQWHPSRRAAIAAGMGRQVVGSSYEDQIRMVDWELRNTERAAGDALRRTTTAAQAGAVVSTRFERPLNTDSEASIRAGAAAALGRRWEADPPHQEAALPATGITSDTPTPNPRRLPLHDDPSSWPSSWPGSAQKSDGSTHSITVDFNGMPNGATVRTQSQGDGAEISGINIRRAMPQAGASPFNTFAGP